MTQLEKLRDLIAAKKPCEAQFGPFCQAIERGDELTAWQTVLGNRGWFRRTKAIALPENLETLAGGIGVQWHDNGTLCSRYAYDNGELHGLYESWHENGTLRQRCTYENNRRHGLYELWYADGTPRFSCAYEHGRLISVNGFRFSRPPA